MYNYKSLITNIQDFQTLTCGEYSENFRSRSHMLHTNQ